MYTTSFYQLAKRKPEMPVIAGCFRGLTAFLQSQSKTCGMLFLHYYYFIKICLFLLLHVGSILLLYMYCQINFKSNYTVQPNTLFVSGE